MKKIKIISIILLFLGASGFLIFKIFGEKSPFSSCVILEEKFCKKGEKVYIKGEFSGLGFNLPEETKIFAPYDGFFSPGNFHFPKEKGFEEYPGISFHKTPKRGESVGMAFSKINFKIDLKRPGSPVKKGEVIGLIAEGKIEPLGDYNFFLILADKEAKTMPILPNNYWKFFK